MTTYLNPSTRNGGVEQIVVPERQSAVPVDDAPFDDEQYVRVNGEWVPYTAPPIIPDTLAPKPPTGLGATGTMAGNGSSVDYALSWTAPTENSDGSPLTDFAYYVIRWRYGLGGVYQSFTTKDTSFLLSGLVPNKDVEWGVVARDYSGNDSTWAEALIDGLADTTAPDKPNPPILDSRLGTLIVTWDGLLSGGAPPADFDHLEVYASATTGGPWEPVGRLAGAGMVVAAGIPVGQTRYVTTIARDTSGNSSTRSDESSIEITGVTGPDLEANSVTANAIEAGAVGAQQLSAVIAILTKICSAETGRRWEADQDGIRVYDDTGAVIINFPTNLADGGNTIKGELTATLLNVEDNLKIMGLVNEISKGSRLVLSSGTTTPSGAPTLTVDWESIGPATDPTFDPYKYGLTYYSGKYYYLQDIYGANTALGRIDAGTGARDYWGYNAAVIRSGIGGITTIGGTAYLFGHKVDGTWAVEKWNLTTNATAGSWNWTAPTTMSGTPAIGNDGTNLLIGMTLTDGTVQWQVRNPSTGAQVGSTVVTNHSTTRAVMAIMGGNFDFGAGRVIMQFKDAAEFGAVFTTAGVRQANEEWPLATGAKPRGSCWDSNRGQFVSYDPNAGKLHFYTGTKWTTESSTWWGSYTWANPSTSSETAQSARRSIAMKKRARLLVSLPARPVTDAAVTHTRVYLGRAGTDPGRTGMWQQGADITGTSMLLSSVAFSGTNPPAASSFTNSSPARIESGAGNIYLNGDGTGSAGAITWGASSTSDTSVNGKFTAKSIYSSDGNGGVVIVGTATTQGEPSVRLRRQTSDALHDTEGYLYVQAGTGSNVSLLTKRDGATVNQLVLREDGRMTVDGKFVPIFAGGVVSAPSIAAGAFWTTTVTFPSGRFTSAPRVTVTATSGRLNAAVRGVTATSCTVELFNCSAASTGTSESFTWTATQE